MPVRCPTRRRVPERVRGEIAKVQQGSPPGVIVDQGTGNIWLVRGVSQSKPDFGVIAIDLGRAPAEAIGDVRQRVDDALSDAAATLERLDVARALNEARMRSETELLREALIGSVSHELRTPLASILGAATVLSKSPAVAQDERLMSLADVVRDEAERLNNDIQNLLDATRISRQQIKPRQEWIEPQDIVNSALERRQRRLAGHSITLDMDSNLPFIYVDPVMVEQAFVQIVDNAAKYSPAGSTIAVAAKRNGHDVILSVKDKGVGLTSEENAQLGERFFRGARHAATTSGSGLGLWIAKAFVVANGGKIRRGKLRRAIAARPCRSICRSRPMRANQRRALMTEASPVVLVVDDEVQIRRFLRAGLELDGFTVQDAETGTDALRWVTLKPPDLVILDLGLPDMDGSEVLERLRAWSSVPLIVLSVRSNEAEKVRLLESGADDYVVKPFGMAELLARAHAAMRRQVRVSSGEPVVQGRAARHRPRGAHRHRQRRARDADAEGVPAAAAAGPARRQRRHASVPAEGSVGFAASAGYALPADIRAQAAPEDRDRPDPAAHPVDRTRRRLPAGGARTGRGCAGELRDVRQDFRRAALSALRRAGSYRLG